ncbi:Membrane protein involved in the export of O-antigen and teichoic acid [Parelusimicrobium proximum]|uniref:lipopolysaccharide biosynthesis protein n=1 Tax=Parelusimicrobium proximum TaxID=3228953 RepID=UPI003D183070
MLKKIQSLGKETLIYGTSTVVARLLNFCLVPFYTYQFANAEYGIVTTVFSLIALFYVIYLFGMDQAFLRFASGKDDKSEVFKHSLYGVFCFGLVLSVLIYMFSDGFAYIIGIGADSGYLIKMSVFILFLDALNMITFTKLRLERRAWYFAGTRTVSIIINVVLNIVFIAYMGLGIAGVMWANIFASLVSLLVLLPVTLKEIFPRPFIKINKTLRKDMLKFAWPFVPSGISSIIVNVIDKPIIIYLGSLAMVGTYQANFKVGVFMMLVVSMFDQAWRPFFLQHSADANCKNLFAKIFTFYIAIGLWAVLGLSLLMPEIIRTPVFGYHFIKPTYWGGMHIIPFVLMGYFFYGIYINFMVAPVITKKTQVLLFATILGAVVSIVTNILLIPRVGILGAGMAIFLSYVVMAGVLFVFLQRNYPIEYEYGKIAKLALSATAVVFVLYILPDSLPAMWTVGVKVALLILFPLIALKVINIKSLAREM